MITPTESRERVKDYLSITGTDFNTVIDSIIEDVTPRLAPFFRIREDEETATLATDDEYFDLDFATQRLLHLWMRTSTAVPFSKFTLWTQNGRRIYLRTNITTTTYIKYVTDRVASCNNTDYGLLPSSAALPLVLFAQAEFYVRLSGDKAKFNLYQQMNGARSVDEMREQSEYLEARAVRIAREAISEDN